MSSHNSLVDVISCTPRSAESDPTIQQTEAALSPKLLKILQYRESTQKSAPVFRTPGQRAIMQRLKAVGEVLQGSSLSSPSSSNTVSTTGNDSWHTADPGVTIPQILVQEDEPTLSNGSGSSFTAVDISECQRATSAGSETNHMVSMMNSPRALDSRSNRRDNDTKEVRNTTKPETQQRGPLGQKPGRPLPRGRAHYRSLLAFPPMGADLDTTTQAMKSLEIEPTPSRQSSSKRKGECAILPHLLHLIPDLRIPHRCGRGAIGCLWTGRPQTIITIGHAYLGAGELKEPRMRWGVQTVGRTSKTNQRSKEGTQRVGTCSGHDQGLSHSEASSSLVKRHREVVEASFASFAVP